MNTSTFSIVIVDDDADDFYLTSLALEAACTVSRIEHIATIEEWQSYWTEPQSIPSLVLMDLRFPVTTGLELLNELKQHPCYRVMPVVMWSGSANQDEVQACYEAGAASFIQKPTSIDKLKQQMRSLCSFWLFTARLPSAYA